MFCSGGHQHEQLRNWFQLQANRWDMASIAERISLAKTCLEADFDKAALYSPSHLRTRAPQDLRLECLMCRCVLYRFLLKSMVPAIRKLRCLETKIDILW